MLLMEAFISADAISNDISWGRKVLDMLGYFTKIYSAVALALFCILARTVSLHLRSIQFRFRNQFTNELVEFQNCQLKILRKQHRLACSLVRKLNYWFGFFLLLEVVFIFVGVTNCLMFVLMGAVSEDGLMILVNGVFCFDHLVHLLVLASYSDGIVNEVII